MTTVTIVRNLASQEGSVLKFKVRNFTQWLNKKKQEWRSKGYEVHYTKEVPYKLHARKKIKNSNCLFQLNIHCINHPQSIQDSQREYERD